METAQLMTKEESYAERRQLFKDIWETSMTIDDKEDVITKPKVIKTLRLSEVDRCTAKKKKKQKLKNLRAVCNKLLDFCDRQDADDLLYEQIAASEGKKTATSSDPTVEPKIKKKLGKNKKKIIKTKSMFAPTTADTKPPKPTAPHRKHPLPKKISRCTSTIKIKRTCISFAPSKIPKTIPIHSIQAPRAVVKLNRSKRKESVVQMQKSI